MSTTGAASQADAKVGDSQEGGGYLLEFQGQSHNTEDEAWERPKRIKVNCRGRETGKEFKLNKLDLDSKIHPMDGSWNPNPTWATWTNKIWIPTPWDQREL